MVLGVLGGMGTYATINIFQEYAKIFPAEKEWDRPRIIIDNRCTMPSRVRAFVYNENVEQLVDEMTDSMLKLHDMGCSKIILACNTSHLFLPLIYKKAPILNGIIFNIIENCVKCIQDEKIENIYLLGSEGTIDSQIYQNLLNNSSIKCSTPEKKEYNLLRNCIEAVKQDKYNDEIHKIFCELVNKHESCILGCTELPILYDKYKDDITCKNIFDPLNLALKKIKEIYDNEKNTNVWSI